MFWKQWGNKDITLTLLLSREKVPEMLLYNVLSKGDQSSVSESSENNDKSDDFISFGW